MFERGRLYRFRPLRGGGRWGGSAQCPSREALTKSARCEYLSAERGRGVTLSLFRSASGGWLETFTPARLGDYAAREAGR
jgi:hypothetical protein